MECRECRYALTDEQWERLQALDLPGCAGHVGRPAKDTRLFVEAVLFRFRAGIAWRDLPARFGHWHRVYVRFNRWSQQDVWQEIFEQLSHDKDNEYAFIDSTTVRAHRVASGAQKKGHYRNHPQAGKHWSQSRGLDDQDPCGV